MLYIIINLFSLTQIIKSQPYIDFSIYPSSTSAGAYSNYTFVLFQFDKMNLTSNTNIQITLPTEYQNILTNGAYDCIIEEWIPTLTIPNVTCTLSGLILTLNNAFSTITGAI